jgi:hypothetical protein
MQFAPNANEYKAIESMSEFTLLEYFITRVAEVEEVWGLGDASGWVMREAGDVISLPVWPYRQLAIESAIDEWETQVSNAVSMEHFISKVLKMLIDANIKVEIMPRSSRHGQLIDPQELLQLFESVIESGEYYIDG